MKRAITLIAAAFSEQFQAERAYIGNFWFGVLTKLTYNVMFLLFINQLYSRVGHLGSFSKNDFLFLFLLSQFGFYLCYYGIFYPMQYIIRTVRNGNFDLILLKPVPHRSYLYISGMSMYELLLTGGPSLILIATQINWPSLHLEFLPLCLGLLVWASGIVICNTVLLALALPVFKNGEATDTMNAFYSITPMTQMPYSRLPLYMKIAALVVFPQIIIAGAGTEVILAKDVAFAGIIIGAAVVSAIAAQFMWKWALRNYTSASS